MKVTYNQAGYVGQSMSVRASEAYQGGKMPFSKWGKAAILSALKGSGTSPERLAIAQKAPLEALRCHCLQFSEWHHVGKFLQEIDFYDVREEGEIDWEAVQAWRPAEKPEPVVKWALVSFREWEKTSRYGGRYADKCGIATWTERGEKTGMAIVYGCDCGPKRVSSLYVLEELPKRPAKNAKVWKRTDYRKAPSCKY